MQTVLTDDPDEAARFIREGRIAAFPTETVYGLGADAFDASAVQAVFAAKGRPPGNPLIVHVAERAQMDRLAAAVPEAAEFLIDRFFPGPLTLVLPRRADVPDAVTAGLPTVGIRMPRHAVALAFLRAAGVPVAAPSANLSGRPSPTTWEAVMADLDGRIPCILRGPQSDAGLESSVVDCTGARPVLLRPGAVSLEQLREVVDIHRAEPGEDLLARSPGTRFRHYRPRARVHLVSAPPEHPPPRSTWIGLEEPPEATGYLLVRVCPGVEAYARDLFAFFRTSEAAGAEHIFCGEVDTRGLGLALMDRLRRAAE